MILKTLRKIFLVMMLMTVFNMQSADMQITTTKDASNRVQFAAEMLEKALEKSGKQVETQAFSGRKSIKSGIILLDLKSSASTSLLKILKISKPENLAKEGFLIEKKGNLTIVVGADGNGVIYACREIIDRMKNGEINLPATLQDAPEMVLRGTAIGVQKPTYLPGRTVYEYPYTPESFPWLYDKAHWIEYLDMLVANRMNSLYLWNGHPFASLVRLKDYPYAVEVDDKTFRKNEEIFQFLTHEADKRGIFVIQMFYNILVSKPFAEHHGIETQNRNRPITPLISDYTRKSIAAFVEKYPNVGLLITLGEAMDTYDDDVKWFTETIIPGVKDGLKSLQRQDEPPIILRAHDTDAKRVMDASLPIYKNLYTMHKYNGESLTTYEPRGPWTKIHTDLSSLGSVHISNVHILANLEPWRYGSPEFIRKTVLAMHNTHGANALHLYPQSSFWDWPYTADKLADGSRLKQIDRDWIWYKTWGRYAWNSQRDQQAEFNYWNDELADYYGLNAQDAEKIRLAYDESGEIAPKLLRRFGITEGNRQTLLLGMFMSQLVNPYKYKIYPGFYESCGPEGEKLIEFIEKKWKKQPHTGELPLDIVSQVIAHGEKAANDIDAVAGKVTRNKAEFKRLQNDMHAYREFAHFFENKVKAAALVLDYQWGNDIQNLDNAIPYLQKSLEHYSKLVDLTKNAYLYANSMQTAQRRIPIGGDNGKNKTWEELLVHYQKEFKNYLNNLEVLKANLQAGNESKVQIQPVKNMDIQIDGYTETILLDKGAKLYADNDAQIDDLAPELKGMKALVLNTQQQVKEGTTISFESKEAVKLLIGYFREDQMKYAKAPTLETDAAANLYGQAEPVLLNAIRFKGLPILNVHSYDFEAGKNKLLLPKGMCVVLGFTTDNMTTRNAGMAGKGDEETMDWMFY